MPNFESFRLVVAAIEVVHVWPILLIFVFENFIVNRFENYSLMGVKMDFVLYVNFHLFCSDLCLIIRQVLQPQFLVYCYFTTVCMRL